MPAYTDKIPGTEIEKIATYVLKFRNLNNGK